MKKVILTFALLSLVVLTSFTTTQTQTQLVAETGDTGGSGTGQIGNGNTTVGTNKRLDYSVTTVSNKENTNSTLESSNNLSFNMEAKKKLDI